MGFRCPICRKDFGIDKEKRQKHCAEEHLGAGKIILEGLVKALDSNLEPNTDRSIEEIENNKKT